MKKGPWKREFIIPYMHMRVRVSRRCEHTLQLRKFEVKLLVIVVGPRLQSLPVKKMILAALGCSFLAK